MADAPPPPPPPPSFLSVTPIAIETRQTGDEDSAAALLLQKAAEQERASIAAVAASAADAQAASLAQSPALALAKPEQPLLCHFEYRDRDTALAEAAELMSLSEAQILQQAQKEFAEAFGSSIPWADAPAAKQRVFIQTQLEILECVNADKRCRAGLALQYLAQGASLGDRPAQDQLQEAQANNRMLLASGALRLYVQNFMAARDSIRQETIVPLATPLTLRLWSNLILCLLEFAQGEALVQELNMPIVDKSPLFVVILNILHECTDSMGRCYPIKKLLLIAWKCLLLTSGGAPVKAHSGACKATQQDLTEFENRILERFAYTRHNLPTPLRETYELLQKGMSIGKKLSSDDSASTANWTPTRRPTLMDVLPPLPPMPRALQQDQTMTETIYRLMLPNLQRVVVTLLKILLAASPTVKSYAGSINLQAELLINGTDVLQDDVELRRHKEIVVKLVSALLLMLLKHFKANAPLQFEFMSLLVSDSNCILLILKFFNQDLWQYITSQNEVPLAGLFPGVSGDPIASSDPTEVRVYVYPNVWLHI
eukprot:TRINITY_DN4752_c0_g1_i3.p1 TRINITY_DN4752_c0_g1~~TRINITY_DN4752_c0_g1_i3.p1  ORF type:complete len:549 (+),score=136.25 TRINITY_DN4752_c0_g1_i3:22-1647(+)